MARRISAFSMQTSAPDRREVNIQLLAKVRALGKEAMDLSHLKIPKKEQNSPSLIWILTDHCSRYKCLQMLRRKYCYEVSVVSVTTVFILIAICKSSCYTVTFPHSKKKVSCGISKV